MWSALAVLGLLAASLLAGIAIGFILTLAWLASREDWDGYGAATPAPANGRARGRHVSPHDGEATWKPPT